MQLKTPQDLGKVTTTLQIANLVDEIFAERGFMEINEARFVTLENVLVDTGATRLCLPANVIQQLGFTRDGEIDVKLAIGIQRLRVFKRLKLSIEGRYGEFNCIELPEGEEPVVGLIPLGLESDLQRQKLRVLPDRGRNTYLTIL